METGTRCIEKIKTGAPKITFVDEPFEFDEQLVDFEEAFEEDFNKENSNGNANNGDNNSNDKSIDTNGNKLGTSISVLPTVIEENETDSYIPLTSKSNQHQHQQEQNRQMKHLGVHIDHRLVRHQYQVVMVYLLVIPNIHHKHKDQHLVYHLNLIHNNNNSNNNNSHHHHYCHRTKTINTTNRIYNPHLQGVNYHLQDQKYQISPPQSNSSNYSPSSLSQPSHYRPTEPRFERRIRDYQTDEQPSEEEKLLIERRNDKNLKKKHY